MEKNSSEEGPLLRGFLFIVDLWRSYASPLQHPYFSSATSSAGKNRRDVLYIISLIAAVVAFLMSIHIGFTWCRAVVCSICVYRVLDIFVSLLRIGVSGLYGSMSGSRLSRLKVMRNTLAVLVNYVELVPWYAAIYYVHGSRFPTDYSAAMTGPLSIVLSFTTATTIGYGNIAPQSYVAAIICYAQALTCILLVSFVIGNLIGLALAPSQPADAKTDGDTAPHPDPRYLTASGKVWLVQRLLVLAFFFAIVYCYLTLERAAAPVL